ncbi:MAG: hypothetical protein VZR36_06410 [Prevotella sp.]|nr:hypothetical protein [Prevotella sp.]
MKKNFKMRNDVRCGYIDFDYAVKVLNFDESNRCHGIDDGNFCESVMKTANARIRNSYNMLKKEGWDNCCPLVVHEVESEGNKWYVTDGQGRFEALIRLNRELVANGKEPAITEIPVTVYHCQTIEDVRNAMIKANTRQKNWTAIDVLHHNAIKFGGTSLNVYNRISTMMDELGITSKYIPSLIIMGSHKAARKDLVADYPEDLIMPTCDEFFNAFKKFYNNVCNRDKRLNNKFKSNEMAIALESVMRSIASVYRNDNIETYNFILNKCMDIIANYLDKLDDRSLVRIIGAKNAIIRREFIELLSKRKDKKIQAVVEVMRKNNSMSNAA